MAPPDGSAPSTSVATTGGVYKWQGRIQGALMTHPYKAFLVQGRQLQASIPRTTPDWHGFSPSSRQSRAKSPLGSTPWLCQCSARAAQDIWEHHRPAVVSRMLALCGMALSTSEKLEDPALSGDIGTPVRVRGPLPEGTVTVHPTWIARQGLVGGRCLTRYRNQPDKSLHQSGAAMHHHPKHQERALNLSIPATS